MQIGEKYNCSGENFRGLLAFAAPKDATPPIFAGKTFVNSHKTAKWYPYDINPCCIQRYKFMSIGRRVQEISLHKVTPMVLNYVYPC